MKYLYNYIKRSDVSNSEVPWGENAASTKTSNTFKLPMGTSFRRTELEKTRRCFRLGWSHAHHPADWFLFRSPRKHCWHMSRTPAWTPAHKQFPRKPLEVSMLRLDAEHKKLKCVYGHGPCFLITKDRRLIPRTGTNRLPESVTKHRKEGPVDNWRHGL